MSTLAQFRTAVSAKIGLDNSTTGDQTAIDAWINEGVTDVLMRTSCKVSTASTTLTAGVGDYTLDTDILKILHASVTDGTVTNWLGEVTSDDIVALNIMSSVATSPAQFYAVAGSNLFLVYPTPATADTVTFFYVPRPTTLSASSDSPSEIPAEFHKAVEYYALCEAADFSDDGTSQQGMKYLQMYEQWIKRIKRWNNMKGGHRRPRATVVGDGTPFPFRDRSVYPQI